MNVADHFEIIDGRGFFRPVGNASLEEAVGWVSAAIAHAIALEVTELLVDAREVTGFDPPGLFQRYDLMKQWLAVAAGRVRTVLVLQPEMIDPRKFGVLVAENRDFAADVFTTEEDALAWLDSRRNP